MTAFAPEALFHIGTFPITNTFLNTLFVDGVLIGITYAVTKHISLIPNRLQNVVEIVFESFYNLIADIAPDRVTKIFPYFITFFLFIIVANWSGLIPGVGSIGIKEGESHEIIPILRGATSDINTTFALAIISVLATHIMSIRTIGIKEYLGRFFSFNPVFLFVGLLEIVSEFTKIISLSFRLFGNIFAGEVVLKTVSTLYAFILPVPFMMLEVIVGLVQALVFSMLTFVFMVILTTSHTAHEEVSEK